MRIYCKRYSKALQLGFYSLFITIPLSWLVSNQPQLGPALQPFDEVTVVKIGTKIAIRGHDEYGKSLPKKGERLIVSMAECDSCSITALDLKQLSGLPQKTPLIMVYPDKRTLTASIRLGVRTIDTSPSWLPKEMTIYRPQAALVDTNGNVIASAFGGTEILQLAKGHGQ